MHCDASDISGVILGMVKLVIALLGKVGVRRMRVPYR